MALAACREILAWPERKKLYSSYRMRLADATSYVSEAAGATSRISRSNLALRISWQAQCLVSLKGGFTCSADCK